MKYSVILKTSVSALGLAVLITSVPTRSSAEEYNICKLDTVPNSIQRKITRRADYPDLLARMFDSCPDAALALTELGGTATTTSDRYPESNQNRDPNPNGGTRGGGNDGGGEGGGGNGGGEGGGGNGGGEGGGGNGGGEGDGGNGDGEGGGGNGGGEGDGGNGGGEGGDGNGDGEGGGEGGDGEGSLPG